MNSPSWTLHFSFVTHLHIRRINVTNPPRSENTDGIDLDCVENALVEESFVSVGDDALCVKSGKDYFGRVYGRPSRNIVFRNVTIGAGHGVTVGSEMSAGIYNVTFEHIFIEKSDFGPRLKTRRGRGGTIDLVVFRNIYAWKANTMIEVDMMYFRPPK